MSDLNQKENMEMEEELVEEKKEFSDQEKEEIVEDNIKSEHAPAFE